MTISLVNACLPVHENEGRDGDHGPVEDYRLGVRIPTIGYTVDNPVCCGTRWRSYGGGSSGVVRSHIRRWARHMGYLGDVRRELGSDRSWCQLAKHPVILSANVASLWAATGYSGSTTAHVRSFQWPLLTATDGEGSQAKGGHRGGPLFKKKFKTI